MELSVRRWLLGMGVIAVAGASLLSQGGIAVAAPASNGALIAHAADAARAARASATGVPQSPAYHPPRQALQLGSRGAAVRNLQRRLRVLKYQPGRADGVLGPDTLAAVWAFKEVQGLAVNAANADYVSLSTLRRLVHPRAPKVLVPRGGRNLRVEINLKRQVLVLYHHNRVELITHISGGGGYYYPCPGGGGTCGPAITPTGDYRFLSYAPGWIQVPLGEMYNSSFFIGRAYAVHGDTYVPWYPASHGCVRIPMSVASYFHKLVHIPGTPVYIR